MDDNIGVIMSILDYIMNDVMNNVKIDVKVDVKADKSDKGKIEITPAFVWLLFFIWTPNIEKSVVSSSTTSQLKLPPAIESRFSVLRPTVKSLGALFGRSSRQSRVDKQKSQLYHFAPFRHGTQQCRGY